MVPSNSSTRLGLSCETGNKEGLFVLLLDVCKNWSVHKPKSELEEKIGWNTIRIPSAFPETQFFWLRDIFIQSGSNSDRESLYIQGLILKTGEGNLLNSGTTIYKPYRQKLIEKE